MANDRGGLAFLAGMLLGTGVGAAAALLLAPQSGEETRDVIRESGLEIKSRAEDVSEEGRQRAQDLGDKARNSVEQRGRLQKAIGQGKEAYENKREELTQRM